MGKEREWCKSKFKGYYKDRRVTIAQGSVVLVSFGSANGSSHLHGAHPAYVLSPNKYIDESKTLWVVPLFHDPSKYSFDTDVPLHQGDCYGLKWSGYLNTNCLQHISVSKVLKRIGRVKNPLIHGLLVVKIANLF